MKLNCLILDDEQPAIRVLERFVAQTPWLEHAASFSRPKEALAYLKEQTVDLLLLDIQMPGMDGFGLLAESSHTGLVIFTTAYADYALQGFEWAAVDYLLKPIAYDRFLRAATRALQLHELGLSREEHLSFRADRRLYRLAKEEILYVQAYGDYLKIQTKERLFTPKMRLQELEERLPTTTFLRVHRSWMINANAIEYMEGNHVVVHGQKIPVSESHRETIQEIFK